MIYPKYQIFRDGEDGQFYYQLKAADGKIVLNSEGYPSREFCLDNINLIRRNARFDNSFDRKNEFSNYTFVLKCCKGEVLAEGEAYYDTNSREGGIYAVKRDGITAPVEDLSENRLLK